MWYPWYPTSPTGFLPLSPRKNHIAIVLVIAIKNIVVVISRIHYPNKSNNDNSKNNITYNHNTNSGWYIIKTADENNTDRKRYYKNKQI